MLRAAVEWSNAAAGLATTEGIPTCCAESNHGNSEHMHHGASIL